MIRRLLVGLVLAVLCVFCSDVASYADAQPIGTANTTANSWYGSGAWAMLMNGTAGGSGTITVPEPRLGDGSPSATANLCVYVWVEGSQQFPDSANTQPDASIGGRCNGAGSQAATFTVETGQVYYWALVDWDPSGDAGKDFDFGDIAGQLATPAAPVPDPDPSACTGAYGCGTADSPVVVTSNQDLTVFLTMGFGLLIVLQAVHTVNGFRRG